MANGYRIRVVGQRATDVPRTRNMAEELHLEFRRRGYGTTSDPDTLTTEFQVNVKAARNLDEAIKLMRTIIKKHHMENDVEIESV